MNTTHRDAMQLAIRRGRIHFVLFLLVEMVLIAKIKYLLGIQNK